MNDTLAGFLYLSKVFDTADHNIFLAKLDIREFVVYQIIVSAHT